MLFARAAGAGAGEPDGLTAGADDVVVVAVPPQAAASAIVTAPRSCLVIAEMGRVWGNDAASDSLSGLRISRLGRSILPRRNIIALEREDRKLQSPRDGCQAHAHYDNHTCPRCEPASRACRHQQEIHRRSGDRRTRVKIPPPQHE